MHAPCKIVSSFPFEIQGEPASTNFLFTSEVGNNDISWHEFSDFLYLGYIIVLLTDKLLKLVSSF